MGEAGENVSFDINKTVTKKKVVARWGSITMQALLARSAKRREVFGE